MNIPPEYRAAFAGKRITVMGLGLLGRGIGDARFLAECGAELIITDLKSADALASSVAQFADMPQVHFVLGEHRLEDFEDRDMILKAAGVPEDSPYLVHAHEHGVPIEMSAALVAKLSRIPIVGVTGTRGKSTVTQMIYHTLTSVTEGGRVLLGGNVRGVANLPLLAEVVPGETIGVFELDSWQLQGFGEAKLSPHIGVFTSFMDDHLNYYKGDVDAYLADKLHIFRHQNDTDVFITTREVLARIESYAKRHGQVHTAGELVLVDPSILPDDIHISMPGEHNRLNAALAFAALRALGLEEDEILAGLTTFRGVEGRLEYMGLTDSGVAIYNDNNATTPDATVAALRALDPEKQKKLVLIMGGADKNIATDALIDALAPHVKTAILLPGTGTEKIADAVASEVSTERAETLDAALTQALADAEQGDIVLFSPAFASFGLFANEYERNDAFVALVRAVLDGE